MSEIRAVGTAATCAGFALAGIPVSEASGARDATAVIAPLLDGRDVGVLLVEQSLLDSLGDAERQTLMRTPSPVVVPFPGPAWGERASPAEAYVLELLQRAIGYRVRLR
ncbi:MAG: V-type ATP synthase subunit F [Gemmatimonadaceae bacterium]